MLKLLYVSSFRTPRMQNFVTIRAFVYSPCCILNNLQDIDSTNVPPRPMFVAIRAEVCSKEVEQILGTRRQKGGRGTLWRGRMISRRVAVNIEGWANLPILTILKTIFHDFSQNVFLVCRLYWSILNLFHSKQCNRKKVLVSITELKYLKATGLLLYS